MTPASTAARVLATAQPVSSWQWMPSRPLDPGAHVGDDPAHAHGQHAAVGVAQDADLRAGPERRLQHADAVVGVGAWPSKKCSQSRNTRRPWPTRKATVSATIARFSSSVVRSASRTWRTSDFATRQTTGVCASSSARTCASSSTRTPALRVAPNATSCACRSSSSVRARAKNSVSLGSAPGQPPSM